MRLESPMNLTCTCVHTYTAYICMYTGGEESPLKTNPKSSGTLSCTMYIQARYLKTKHEGYVRGIGRNRKL